MWMCAYLCDPTLSHSLQQPLALREVTCESTLQSLVPAFPNQTLVASPPTRIKTHSSTHIAPESKSRASTSYTSAGPTRHQRLNVLPFTVFFSTLSFSGIALLSTWSHVEERARMRVCSCDLVAFTWYMR